MKRLLIAWWFIWSLGQATQVVGPIESKAQCDVVRAEAAKIHAAPAAGMEEYAKKHGIEYGHAAVGKCFADEKAHVSAKPPRITKRFPPSEQVCGTATPSLGNTTCEWAGLDGYVQCDSHGVNCIVYRLR